MCPQLDGNVPDKLVYVKLKIFKDSKLPVLPQAEGRVPAQGAWYWAGKDPQAQVLAQASV